MTGRESSRSSYASPFIFSFVRTLYRGQSSIKLASALERLEVGVVVAVDCGKSVGELLNEYPISAVDVRGSRTMRFDSSYYKHILRVTSW